MIRTLLSTMVLMGTAAPAFSSAALAQGATMSPPAPYLGEGMPQSANSVPAGARTLSTREQRNANGAGVIYQYKSAPSPAPQAPAGR